MANPSYTYSLTNGSTADASQVMQDFNDILNGVTDGTKDLSISALTVAGTCTLNGAINLGNASSDDITITGSLASSFPIKTTDTYVLGDATHVMSNMFSTRYAVGDGLVGTPALYFTADTDTGIYRIGANELGISVGGALKVDVTSANGTKIVGTANNDDAASLYIGEVLGPISRARSSGTGLTNNTTINVCSGTTSITLTAGDWHVQGAVAFLPVNTTVCTELDAAISATSATLPANTTIADPSGGECWMTIGIPFTGNGNDVTIAIPTYRVTVANGATLVLYLVARGSFSVSTLSVYGSMFARRVR